MLKSTSLKLTLCAATAAAGLVALPASTFAGTDAKAVVTPAPAITKAITGDLGVNFVSAYFTRGIIVENQGLIAQPYLDLYFDLYEGTGVLNKISLNLGIWSSIHSKQTGAIAGSTVPAWNEFDWTPGVTFTLAKNFAFTATYLEFDSPNGAFNPARSANFTLAYTDTDYLGAFALHPHVTYLKELSGKAGTGPSYKKGDYFEIGIAPGLPAYGPVTVTLPATAGFGTAGFYAGGKGLGYVSVGPNVAIALPFIPAAYGVWTATTSATYYYLHGSLATANAIQSSNHNQFVFSGGIGLTF